MPFALRHKSIFIVILFFFGYGFINAQGFYRFHDDWFLRAGIGNSYFFGDVNDNNNRIWKNGPLGKYYYEDRKLLFLADMGKYLNPVFFLRGQFLIGGLQGSNEAIDQYFYASMWEANLSLGMDFTNLFLGADEDRVYSIYGTGGAGMLNFRTINRTIHGGEIIANYGYNDAGEKAGKATTESIIPFALGANFYLSDRWKFNFETSYGYVLSDKLDALKSSEKSVEGFGYYSIGMVYTFDLFISPRIYSSRSSGHYNPHTDKTLKKYQQTQNKRKLLIDPFKKTRKKRNYLFKRKKKLH